MMIAAMMVAALSVNAQEVEVGQVYLKPMVGATLSRFTGDVDDIKMKFGVLGGAELGYKIAEPFDITAGLLVMMQGTKVKDTQFTKDFSSTLTYLNVPILANFYVARGLAIKAGVQPGFLLSSKTKAKESYGGDQWETIDSSSKDGLKKFDLAIPVGLSYEFSNFIIDARYNFGLLKVEKDGGSVKNGVIMLTVGYKIPF